MVGGDAARNHLRSIPRSSGGCSRWANPPATRASFFNRTSYQVDVDPSQTSFGPIDPAVDLLGGPGAHAADRQVGPT